MVRAILLTLAACLGISAGSASAAVLATYTHEYGIGLRDPQGDDILTADGVLVRDDLANPFFDSFDFSDMAGEPIERLSLSITFAGSGPFILPFFNLALERWYLQLDPNSNSAFEDAANLLVSPGSTFTTLTRTIDASTDSAAGETVFADAVSDLSLDFGFVENSLFNGNEFTLASATLAVEDAVVPLPAPVWLLLTALGGLGVAARRQRKRFQIASSRS